ncbi:MAG: hypothetical protein Q8Q97_00765 [bacterium]|nr:hypothetical protein [bacterium]
MQTRRIEIIKVPKADDGFPLSLEERKMFLGLKFPIRRPKLVPCFDLRFRGKKLDVGMHSMSKYYAVSWKRMMRILSRKRPELAKVLERRILKRLKAFKVRSPQILALERDICRLI